MTTTKAGSKAPEEPSARSSYVNNLQRMYEEGTLDETLSRDFEEVPELLLQELFPRLFPMVH